MDPVSQGVLGAAAAQAVARREWLPAAGALGALSGMAPDLDVLIRSSTDPLLFLEYHRQFTHALAFISFGALLCAALFFPVARRRLSFAWTYAFCLIGYATHGLLDACTSFGTQLFWPFSDQRVAWNNVSVVDPAFTIPLLVLIALASTRQRASLARVACAFALLYLGVGVVQRERAEDLGQQIAVERGHRPEHLEAKPAFGSLLLWKTIYEYDDRYHVDAVRVGLRPKAFAGEQVRMLELARDLPWLGQDSQQARDLERFRWFSDGQIALDPRRDDHVIDIRYSLLPNRIEALWGIRLDRRAKRGQHAAFFTAREPSPEHRTELLRMLFD